ncbi:MAG: response regulator [Gemmatimonadota bacterium]
MPSTTDTGPVTRSIHVLLVSAHDWFASALQAVLEPEGFTFARVRSGRIALRDAGVIDPDIVIIDEGLPDLDAPALSAALSSGPLKPSVPILVYSPNFWHETAQAEAMQAGAWDIIKEPVRSRLIVAKLRRLLEIKRLIESSEEGSLSDMATGLFNLAGLMRMLRILGAVANRTEAVLSCAVLGPTEAGRELIGRERETVAGLFSTNTRGSDVCGWVSDTDIAVVAYDTTAAGMTMLVQRLNRLAAEGWEASGPTPLSAGVVELAATPLAEGTRGEEARGAPGTRRMASLSRFAAAQNALREAREAGGGIRVAEALSQ